MSKGAIDAIFAAPATTRRIKIDVPEDIASRFDQLFAERGASEEQKNAVYTLALRRFFDNLERPPRKAKENGNG